MILNVPEMPHHPTIHTRALCTHVTHQHVVLQNLELVRDGKPNEAATGEVVVARAHFPDIEVGAFVTINWEAKAR